MACRGHMMVQTPQALQPALSIEVAFPSLTMALESQHARHMRHLSPRHLVVSIYGVTRYLGTKDWNRSRRLISPRALAKCALRAFSGTPANLSWRLTWAQSS